MTRKFNPYEIKIIQCLQKYGAPMSVTEIQSKTKLSWTTIHKHMKTLQKEEIIIEEEGRYYLDY